MGRSQPISNDQSICKVTRVMISAASAMTANAAMLSTARAVVTVCSNPEQAKPRSGEGVGPPCASRWDLPWGVVAEEVA